MKIYAYLMIIVIVVVIQDGKTALIWACRNGNIAAVEVLLQHGADVHEPDKVSFHPFCL